MVTEGAVMGGRYRLERVIGRGGMADVYAGHDDLLDRPVAVKVPLPGYRDDDRFQRRFAKEARAAAALNHPNVVSIFDRGTDGEVTYLVMELVSGQSLRQLIDGQGFTEDEALVIARDVCAGLEYAHSQGFVHRDLKPDNVLITDDGVTKVTDFGIVRAIGDRSITSTRPLGSVAYVSPEQATGRNVDARSDLYSLGVVLFEMLTGTRPFDAESPVSIALAHIEQDPPSVRSVVPAISPGAAAVVERALAKAPDARFDSATQMREAIEAVLARHGTDAPATEDLPVHAEHRASAELPTGVVGPTRPPATRRLGALAAVAVLAVVVIGALFPAGDEVRVPDVVGLPEDTARATLADRDLGVHIAGFEPTTDVPPGTVTAADPPAGAALRRGEVVQVRLAEAPEEG